MGFPHDAGTLMDELVVNMLTAEDPKA